MKFFYFSPVLNVISLLAGVAILILGFKHFTINKEGLLAFMFFMLFFALLTSSFWQGYATLSQDYIFKVISIIFIVVVGIVFSNKVNFSSDFLIKLSAFYGLVFCAFSALGIIKASASGALSYLNLGLPIGITVISCFLLFLRAGNKLMKLVYILCFLFSFLMMLKTPARGVLLGTLILLLYMCFIYKRKRYILYSIGLVTPLFIIYWDEIYALSSFVIGKMERLIFSMEEEARYDYYVRVIGYFSEQFWGFGLRSYQPLLGFYPHSLLLEFLMVGGVFLASSFLIILILSFTKIFKNIGCKTDLDFIYILSMYFFIQWHLSYELSSAYGLFLCLSLVMSKKLLVAQPKYEAVAA
ncbi:polymerase [Pseudoalteromonas sp. KS88]|nr:polymerase [Pseudoalteromonas sp. KS88]